MRLSFDNVDYMIEGNKVLNRIACTFTPGITYVVGKNGSGKSTLLKLTATAIQPSSGKIEYTKLIDENHRGLYRKQLSIEEIRTIIGYMPQDFTGHPEMTIDRYLKYIAFHKGIPRTLVKTTIKKWLQETNLTNIKRRTLRSLSGGQLKKVGLIQALINQPRICILDEPFEGLDISERLFFERVIRRLSYHNIVIISTHLIDEMADGDILYLIDGSLAFFGGLTEDSQDFVTKSLI